MKFLLSKTVTYFVTYKKNTPPRSVRGVFVGQTVQISNCFIEDFNKLYALHEHIQTVFKKDNKLDLLEGKSVNDGTSKSLDPFDYAEKATDSIKTKKKKKSGIKGKLM